MQYFDKAFAFDPQWKAVKLLQENLLKYLSSIQDLINLKGRVKNKKLQNLIKVTIKMYFLNLLNYGHLSNHAIIVLEIIFFLTCCYLFCFRA